MQVVGLHSGMSNVTEILVGCYHCGHMWRQPLQQPVIGAVNGDTITFAPRSIDVKCPECGTRGVNYTETTVNVTGESIRGLFALLRSASLTGEDIEKLATIASDARKSDTKPEVLVELIKTSVPRLRPALAWITSQESASVAAWIAVLIALVTLVVTVKGQAAAPVQQPTIVLECSSGEEQKISDLFGQIANELRSALKASNTAVGPQVEPRPKNPPDGHLSTQP
jgi:hypothetical protein